MYAYFKIILGKINIVLFCVWSHHVDWDRVYLAVNDNDKVFCVIALAPSPTPDIDRDDDNDDEQGMWYKNSVPSIC